MKNINISASYTTKMNNSIGDMETDIFFAFCFVHYVSKIRLARRFVIIIIEREVSKNSPMNEETKQKR